MCHRRSNPKEITGMLNNAKHKQLSAHFSRICFYNDYNINKIFYNIKQNIVKIVNLFSPLFARGGQGVFSPNNYATYKKKSHRSGIFIFFNQIFVFFN